MRKIRSLTSPTARPVARSHFWEVLAGRKSPTLAWIGRIALALEVDPANFSHAIQKAPLAGLRLAREWHHLPRRFRSGQRGWCR